jgi:hypothetical protein
MTNDGAAVDVDVPNAFAREAIDQHAWIARVELFVVLGCARRARHHDAALARVWPSLEPERGLVRLAPEDERVDRLEEARLAVVLRACLDDREPIDGAICPRDKAVEAGGDEDRAPCAHARGVSRQRRPFWRGSSVRLTEARLDGNSALPAGA